jgi:hypothetical protein
LEDLNGFAELVDNPVTNTDPSGLYLVDEGGCSTNPRLRVFGLGQISVSEDWVFAQKMVVWQRYYWFARKCLVNGSSAN